MTKKVYEAALKKWSKEAQIIVAIEEMSELTKELCKNINRGESNIEKIQEELADVLIMVEQLKIIYDPHNVEVNSYKAQKLLRLAVRLGLIKEEEEKGEAKKD